MSTQCTVVLSQYARLSWQMAGVVAHGEWQDLARALDAQGARKFDAILLPDWYSLHRVNFIDAERKMLAKTVPFSLEDELADDVEDGHFALGELGEGVVDVAVLNHAKLKQLFEDVAAAGLAFNSLTTCPLPADEALWIQLGDDAAALLSSEASVVVEQRQLSAVVSSLADKAQRVVMLSDAVHAWPAWGDNISNAGLFDLLASGRSGIDILQGEFRKGIAWQALWKAWRTPAIAAAVLMAALIGQAWWQVGLLEARNLEYRQAIEKTYREAFPNSRVVNPRRQMEARLGELQGGGGSAGSNMLALLSSLSTEPEASSLQISAVNYEARAAELRIDILADNFQQVEKLRSALRARGVSAELQNSSASGNKVRAKLALKEMG